MRYGLQHKVEVAEIAAVSREFAIHMLALENADERVLHAHPVRKVGQVVNFQKFSAVEMSI